MNWFWDMGKKESRKKIQCLVRIELLPSVIVYTKISIPHPFEYILKVNPMDFLSWFHLDKVVCYKLAIISSLIFHRWIVCFYSCICGKDMNT